MNPVQILHLTDLHLKAGGDWNQELLRAKLLDDLKGLPTRGLKPDVVIFSGDLAQAGGTGAYSIVKDYLDQVLRAVRLKTSDLVTCPGNHDIDRSVVLQHLPKLREWRAQAGSPDGAERLLKDAEFRTYVDKAFKAYGDGVGAIATRSPVYNDGFSAGYHFPDQNLYVVSVNTAALSAGGAMPELEDRAHLFIPESSLETAAAAAPDGCRIVVVGHHPLSWMNDQNGLVVGRALPTIASAYFCGHLHDSVPSQNRTLNGDLLVAQSGALYAHRTYWNGYAVVSFRGGAADARLTFRRWFEPRRSFSKAEDLVDDGVFYSSENAKSHWLEQRASEGETLESWRSNQLLPEILSECNISLSNQELDLVFVKPEFDYEVPYGKEADGRVGSKIEFTSFDEVVKSDKNYVISASSETGKSTLLKQIALHYARREALTSDWTFPVIIQFDGIKGISGYIEKMVRQKLPDLPGTLKVKQLLQSGSMIILVDDVDFSDKARRDQLLSFVSQYPNCRYIFTSGTPFLESAALKPEITKDVPFARIRMRQIRQDQMLALIENHGLTDPLEADKMLARVVRDAGTLNVPLTPVTATFMIQIFQDDPDHVMVNQAALTERYIEILLQKFAPRDLLPGTFDFRNKVDLLATLTEFMVKSDDYAPEYNTILSWVVGYLKNYGLDFSASDLVQYFIDARVFELHGGTVKFRLRMFFEFFAATRMIEHADFRDFVLDDARYLSFINEIAFYAALNRKDLKLVERVRAAFENLSATAWDEKKVDDPEKFFKAFHVPGKSTTEAELDEIYSGITGQEADVITTPGQDESLSDTPTQIIERGRYQTPSEQWFAHLGLLSTLVKHMELVPDLQKRINLASALDGWVQFTANSLGVVNVLAKERRVAFNGITYISTLDDLPLGEMARRLSLSMPAAIARMAGMFIATEKLLPQLTEGIGRKDEPLARQLIRFSIISDMGSVQVPKLGAMAAEQFKGHRFLSHALARKLYEVAVRFRLPKPVLGEVRHVAADLYVALENVPGGKIASRRASIIEGMAVQRRQIDLKKAGQARAVVKLLPPPAG